MIFVYIVLGILITIIVFNLIVKIKFPFWSIQPVFHIYDIRHWLMPNKVIDSSLPQPNKYLKLFDVESHKINNITNELMVKTKEFINEHFLRNKFVEYSPSKEDIFNYLHSEIEPSYISTYQKPSIIVSYNGDIIDRDILGVITARPMYVTINKNTMPVYYVDNLCIHKDNRNKGIAPILIQTHYHNLRNLNKNIKVCLFKREGEMTAIVPLTVFDTIGYECDKIPKAEVYPVNFKLIRITIQNIQLFRDFFKLQANKFKCVVHPELELIIKLIKSENIVMYGLIHNHFLLSLYVFRKVPSVLKREENSESCFECIASINNTPLNSIFVGGFCSAIRRYTRKYKTKILFIENTSDNNVYIDYLNTNKIKQVSSYPCAFFLYNYVSYTMEKKSTILIY
jgi:hypothetical protein